jgi:imidazolonepropionase
VGSEAEVFNGIKAGDYEVIDAGGMLATAGLVDPHTHLIFDGNRANEFLMRCQGKTYSEIAEAGGGIVASMRATRASSRERLVQLGAERLQRMLEAGTTTCEVKTGYGLDKASELNMFEAILELKRSCANKIDIVPTFMPAHAVPPGSDREEYVDHLISAMIPEASRMVPESEHAYVDVFCDRGYFTLDDTRRIFAAASAGGFKLKVHSDEFVNLGATALATTVGADSADHLLNISDAEIAAMADSSTVAVLLPGTSFYLNLHEHARARTMIDAGVAVALGSDFNPGSCHIFSLPLIWGLACLHLKMTVEEALTALTVNSAYAIGMGEVVGRLSPGYQADITLFNVGALEEVPYNLGWNSVHQVIKKGRVAFSK